MNQANRSYRSLDFGACQIIGAAPPPALTNPSSPSGTHRKRGSQAAGCSDSLGSRNLPTTKNPDSRLSLLDLAGLG
jgi:hypothetical protein